MAAPRTLGEAVAADRLHRWRMANDDAYRERHREMERTTREMAERRRQEAEIDLNVEPALGAAVVIPRMGAIPEEHWGRIGTYRGRVRRQPSGAWVGVVECEEARQARRLTVEELKQQGRDRTLHPDEEPRPVARYKPLPVRLKVEVPVRLLSLAPKSRLHEPSHRAEGCHGRLSEETEAVLEEAFFDAFGNT